MHSTLQTLRIPIGHSRWLHRFSLLAALFGLLCWQFVNVDWGVSLLGTAAIVAVAIYQQSQGQPLMVLSFHINNGWSVARGDEKSKPVELLPPMLVTPKLIALRFSWVTKKPGFAKRVSVCLCDDAVPAELHRKLRVVLNTGEYRLNQEQRVR